MRRKNYPILRNLLLIQLSSLAIGIGVFSTIYYFGAKAIEMTEVAKIKQRIEPLLTANEERWRAWSS